MSELWKRIESRERMLLVAGPCLAETKELCLQVAESLRDTCGELGIEFVFKASVDKANRTSPDSYRGPGVAQALEWLEVVRDKVQVPTCTDVHEVCQVARASGVVDVLQVPALLSRQTDLISTAGHSGLIVNIKKGQFMSAANARMAVRKAVRSGNCRVMLTERGTTFGYHDLVVDMRAIAELRSTTAFPVLFDASHSVQSPGSGEVSGGSPQFTKPLALAALAAGADGLFVETHPSPPKALSDGASSTALRDMNNLLWSAAAVWKLRRTL